MDFVKELFTTFWTIVACPLMFMIASKRFLNKDNTIQKK